jgi:hypothetical protein
VRVLGGSGGPLHRDTHYRGSPDHFFGGQPNSLGGIFKAGLEPPFVRDPRTLEPSAEQVQIPDMQPSQIAISGGRLALPSEGTCQAGWCEK